MAAGFGLTLNVARELQDSYTYKYTLYDINDNKISDPEGSHVIVRSNISGEWSTPFSYRDENRSERLFYNGGDLIFGPSNGGWSSVAYVGVEIEIGGSFLPFGAFEIDGGSGVSVADGNSLKLETGANVLVINYKSSQDRPSTYPEVNLPGVWETFIRGVPSGSRWQFTLVTTDGSHDTVTKTDVSWSVSNTGITYQGDEIVWRPFQSAQTEESISVYVAGPEDNAKLVGRAPINTVEDSNGNSSTISTGDVPKANAGDFEITIQ